MKKKKFIIIGGIGLIILLLIIFQAFSKKEAEYSFAKVTKEDITEKISVTGSLIPLKRIKLEVERQGKVEEVAIDIGDKAEEEEALIYLDDQEEAISLQKSHANLNQAQRQVSLSETKLANAKNNLKKVKTRTDQSIQKAESDLSKAEIDLTSKEQNLEDVKQEAANDIQEVYEDARSDLDANILVGDEAILKLDDVRDSYFSDTSQIGANIKGRRDIAKERLNTAQVLTDNTKISESQEDTLEAINILKEALEKIKSALRYVRQEGFEDPLYKSDVSDSDKTAIDTQKSNVEAAISALTSAEQDIDSQKITNQSSINTAQSQLDSTEAALAAAKSNLDYVKSQKEEAVAQAEATIEQTQQELELNKAQVSAYSADVSQARKTLEKMTLKAPLAGTITKLEIEEGETAKPGEVIVVMMPDNNFKIEADVSEVDIGNIEKEDKVEVDFDAYPGEKYVAHVSKIHPAEIVKEGVIYYRIEVILDEYPAKLKPGLTANLDVITGEAKNVLTVPYVAVKNEEGKSYVRVLVNGDTIQRKEVRTGLEGATKIEIKQGLKKEEKIITFVEE